ncbi:MAG: TIGR00730 family Rossman fold protein [Gemmataceae bacterium]
MSSPTRQIRSLCVFCGSKTGDRPLYAEAARKLGHEMAQRGVELVYGAGNIGLMGVVADAVLEAGGRVVGVIPQGLVEHEVAHRRLTELHVVRTMHERKALMADRSDAFLALPGGFGTLDELFEILTWAQLGIHAKPVGLANIAEFFTPLLQWLKHAVAEGYLRTRHQQLLHVRQDPVELLTHLLTLTPGEPGARWITDLDR